MFANRQEVLGPIGADDLAIMLTADTSAIVMERVGRVAGVLFDKLLVHGMQPNLKPSKSEVFVDLRGEGSVECRRQIHEDDYRLHTTSEYLTEPLRIVGSYKHLGTWIQTNVTSIKHVSIPTFVYTYLCTRQLLQKSCSICSYQ